MAGEIETCLDELEFAMLSGRTVQSQLVIDAIMRAVPFIVVDLDNGRIMAASRCAERLFDYLEGELRTKHINALIPPHLQANHDQPFQKFANDPRPRPMGELGMTLKGITRTGREFPIEIGLYPLVLLGKRSCVATIFQKASNEQSPP